jgi:hypothetical protein
MNYAITRLKCQQMLFVCVCVCPFLSYDLEESCLFVWGASRENKGKWKKTREREKESCLHLVS